MKKYDKLIITAEPKVIDMLLGVLSRIRNGCTYLGYGNGSGVILPKEYDFVKVKRKNCKASKKRLKEFFKNKNERKRKRNERSFC